MWIATAMCVFSRLFIWGAVSTERNTTLVRPVVTHVWSAVRRGAPILWVTDGFAGWAAAVGKEFRNPLRTGKPGRPPLHLWPELSLVQIVKHKAGQRLLSITKRLVVGSWDAAQQIVGATQIQLGVFNTAYVERLNASLRTWIPALTRRSRTPTHSFPHLQAALFWTGAIYSFCRIYDSLDGAPAMAADLTKHVWSVRKSLFCFTIRPKPLPPLVYSTPYC